MKKEMEKIKKRKWKKIKNKKGNRKGKWKIKNRKWKK